eukprot:TRINITY_DN25167_c0_g1_i2.p1 TRINITY_DN25167_c0_g1~~TRINITY_DN25167_c0_g1_i2.p1  ORF type:complete len:2875 (+),score=602.52 TRINITY_DN25167_c0_g1_i2:154-8778(+)
MAMPDLLPRLTKVLRDVRGAVLRAWRLDLDPGGTGSVSSADLFRICRGFNHEDIGADGLSHSAGSLPPSLTFCDLAPEESANLDAFIAFLQNAFGLRANGQGFRKTDLSKAWQLLNLGSSPAVSLSEFASGLQRKGFEGDTALLFKGMDSSGRGRLSRHDFETFPEVFFTTRQKPRMPDIEHEYPCSPASSSNARFSQPPVPEPPRRREEQKPIAKVPASSPPEQSRSQPKVTPSSCRSSGGAGRSMHSAPSNSLTRLLPAAGLTPAKMSRSARLAQALSGPAANKQLPCSLRVHPGEIGVGGALVDSLYRGQATEVVQQQDGHAGSGEAEAGLLSQQPCGAPSSSSTAPAVFREVPQHEAGQDEPAAGGSHSPLSPSMMKDIRSRHARRSAGSAHAPVMAGHTPSRQSRTALPAQQHAAAKLHHDSRDADPRSTCARGNAEGRGNVLGPHGRLGKALAGKFRDTTSGGVGGVSDVEHSRELSPSRSTCGDGSAKLGKGGASRSALPVGLCGTCGVAASFPEEGSPTSKQPQHGVRNRSGGMLPGSGPLGNSGCRGCGGPPFCSSASPSASSVARVPRSASVGSGSYHESGGQSAQSSPGAGNSGWHESGSARSGSGSGSVAKMPRGASLERGGAGHRQSDWRAPAGAHAAERHLPPSNSLAGGAGGQTAGRSGGHDTGSARSGSSSGFCTGSAAKLPRGESLERGAGRRQDGYHQSERRVSAGVSAAERHSPATSMSGVGGGRAGQDAGQGGGPGGFAGAGRPGGGHGVAGLTAAPSSAQGGGRAAATTARQPPASGAMQARTAMRTQRLGTNSEDREGRLEGDPASSSSSTSQRPAGTGSYPRGHGPAAPASTTLATVARGGGGGDRASSSRVGAEAAFSAAERGRSHSPSSSLRAPRSAGSGSRSLSSDARVGWIGLHRGKGTPGVGGAAVGTGGQGSKTWPGNSGGYGAAAPGREPGAKQNHLAKHRLAGQRRHADSGSQDRHFDGYAERPGVGLRGRAQGESPGLFFADTSTEAMSSTSGGDHAVAPSSESSPARSLRRHSHQDGRSSPVEYGVPTDGDFFDEGLVHCAAPVASAAIHSRVSTPSNPGGVEVDRGQVSAKHNVRSGAHSSSGGGGSLQKNPSAREPRVTAKVAVDGGRQNPSTPAAARADQLGIHPKASSSSGSSHGFCGEPPGRSPSTAHPGARGLSHENRGGSASSSSLCVGDRRSSQGMVSTSDDWPSGSPASPGDSVAGSAGGRALRENLVDQPSGRQAGAGVSSPAGQTRNTQRAPLRARGDRREHPDGTANTGVDCPSGAPASPGGSTTGSAGGRAAPADFVEQSSGKPAVNRIVQKAPLRAQGRSRRESSESCMSAPPESSNSSPVVAQKGTRKQAARRHSSPHGTPTSGSVSQSSSLKHRHGGSAGPEDVAGFARRERTASAESSGSMLAGRVSAAPRGGKKSMFPFDEASVAAALGGTDTSRAHSPSREERSGRAPRTGGQRPRVFNPTPTPVEVSERRSEKDKSRSESPFCGARADQQARRASVARTLSRERPGVVAIRSGGGHPVPCASVDATAAVGDTGDGRPAEPQQKPRRRRQRSVDAQGSAAQPVAAASSAGGSGAMSSTTSPGAPAEDIRERKSSLRRTPSDQSGLGMRLRRLASDPGIENRSRMKFAQNLHAVVSKDAPPQIVQSACGIPFPILDAWMKDRGIVDDHREKALVWLLENGFKNLLHGPNVDTTISSFAEFVGLDKSTEGKLRQGISGDSAKSEAPKAEEEAKDKEKGKGEKAAAPSLPKGKGGKGKSAPPPLPKGKGGEAKDEAEAGKGSDAKGKGPSKGPPLAAGKDGKGKACKGKDGKGKGKGFNVEPRKPDVRPAGPVKKLYWSSFRLNDQGNGDTVWEAIEKICVALNGQEIEELFCDKPPIAPAGLGGTPKAADASPKEDEKKVTKIQVLDKQRRQQVGVCLARMPPIKRLTEAICNIDSAVLNKDQIELLMLNMPSQEEVQLMQIAQRDYKIDEYNVWDTVEEFVLSLIGIENYSLRMQVWEFENSFTERLQPVRNAEKKISLGCNSILSCGGVQRLLGLVLAIGNYLNGGTPRGRADGFAIDALTQMRALKMSKSDRPGATLVDYLVQEMERQFPDCLEEMLLPGMEAEMIKTASRYKLEEVAQELQVLRTKADKILGTIANKAGQDEVLERHREIMGMCLAEVDAQQARLGELEKTYSKLCSWFHMDEGSHKKSTDEFFGIWDKFFVDVGASRKMLQDLEAKKRLQASRKIRRTPTLHVPGLDGSGARSRSKSTDRMGRTGTTPSPSRRQTSVSMRRDRVDTLVSPRRTMDSMNDSLHGGRQVGKSNSLEPDLSPCRRSMANRPQRRSTTVTFGAELMTEIIVTDSSTEDDGPEKAADGTEDGGQAGKAEDESPDDEEKPKPLALPGLCSPKASPRKFSQPRTDSHDDGDTARGEAFALPGLSTPKASSPQRARFGLEGIDTSRSRGDSDGEEGHSPKQAFALPGLCSPKGAAMSIRLNGKPLEDETPASSASPGAQDVRRESITSEEGPGGDSDRSPSPSGESAAPTPSPARTDGGDSDRSPSPPVESAAPTPRMEVGDADRSPAPSGETAAATPPPTGTEGGASDSSPSPPVESAAPTPRVEAGEVDGRPAPSGESAPPTPPPTRMEGGASDRSPSPPCKNAAQTARTEDGDADGEPVPSGKSAAPTPSRTRTEGGASDRSPSPADESAAPPPAVVSQAAGATSPDESAEAALEVQEGVAAAPATSGGTSSAEEVADTVPAPASIEAGLTEQSERDESGAAGQDKDDVAETEEPLQASTSATSSCDPPEAERHDDADEDEVAASTSAEAPVAMTELEPAEVTQSAVSEGAALSQPEWDDDETW